MRLDEFVAEWCTVSATAKSRRCSPKWSGHQQLVAGLGAAA
jgi:hypothetical protein